MKKKVAKKKSVKKAATGGGPSLVRGAKKKRAARQQGEREQYFWTYADLEPLVTKSLNAVSKDVGRGNLDPNNLESVIAYVVRNATTDKKQAWFPYILKLSSDNPGLPPGSHKKGK